MKDDDSALETLRKFIESEAYEEFFRIFDALPAELAEHPKFIWLRAIAASRIGDWPKARESFEFFYDRDGTNPVFIAYYLRALRECRAFSQILNVVKILSKELLSVDAIALEVATFFWTRGETRRALNILEGASVNSELTSDILRLKALLRVEIGDFPDALSLYQQLNQNDPNDGEIRFNLAQVLAEMGDLERASEVLNLRGSMEVIPYALAFGFHLARRQCDWDLADIIWPKLSVQIETELLSKQGSLSWTPFMSLCYEADDQRNLALAKAWAQPLEGRSSLTSGERPSNRDRKVRIGYLSSNFRNHPTARNVRSLLAKHDRRQFEVYAFACCGDDGSQERLEIKRAVDHFIDLLEDDDFQAAEKIAAYQIDILIALTGHSGGGRLGICAYRPCRMQVSLLSYPGTTGANFMDYILADRFVIPLENQQYFSEQVITLPSSYWPTDPQGLQVRKPLSRKSQGISEEASVVFCAMVQAHKISRSIFQEWLLILQSVDGSVLWLLDGGSSMKTSLRHAATQHGISPDRLIFAPVCGYQDHITRLSLADLALDTDFYGAHTGIIDGLYAGVATLALKGSHFASRVAESLLYNADLGDLVFDDALALRQKAVQLATSPSELAALKRRVQESIKSSALFNVDQYVKDLETAVLSKWKQHN